MAEESQQTEKDQLRGHRVKDPQHKMLAGPVHMEMLSPPLLCYLSPLAVKLIELQISLIIQNVQNNCYHLKQESDLQNSFQ